MCPLCTSHIAAWIGSPLPLAEIASFPLEERKCYSADADVNTASITTHCFSNKFNAFQERTATLISISILEMTFGKHFILILDILHGIPKSPLFPLWINNVDEMIETIAKFELLFRLLPHRIIFVVIPQLPLVQLQQWPLSRVSGNLHVWWIPDCDVE